jgi:hypothetical protein
MAAGAAAEAFSVTAFAGCTADTEIGPALPAVGRDAAAALCLGQGGGYAEDRHLLLRFDDLPSIPGRDLVRVRLGLFREWRGNAQDDADDIVKLVLPAPHPFEEGTETWQSAAAQPMPNHTLRDFQVGEQMGRSLRSHLRVTANPAGQGEYKYSDVTEIARGWFAGTRPNLGLLLITDFGRSRPWNGTAYVTSREGPKGQWPVLEVTYRQRPDGTPDGRWTLVEAEGATETEQTAATELRDYLRRICDEWFEIASEGAFSAGRPAIYVGPTQFARRHRCRVEAMGADEFMMRRVGDDLILCGGRPRGTFYAVTQLLEEFCGVRWLTLHGEEHVPQRPELRLPAVNRRVRPAFSDRDVMVPHHWPRQGWYDEAALARLGRALAFGRINGRASPVHLGADLPPERYGGHPLAHQLGHTIRWYLPPGEFFATHPEYYVLRGGKRVDTGICKANPEMREVYFERVTQAIRKLDLQPDQAFILHISDEDGPPQVCECPDCQALDARYGGNPVGQMLDFLNWLAERGQGVWPAGVTLETLAYSGYETPPPKGRIRDDVIIRFAPIHKCHWDPFDAMVNRRDRENLDGWLERARDVRIWDYPHQYGSGAEPVSGLAITAPGDPGLLAWVRQAAADESVARSGLHLSLAEPTAAGERHVFTADITAFWEPNRGVRPTLLVRWQRPRDREPRLTALREAAAAIASSEQPDRPLDAIWEPGIHAAGGLLLAGTMDQSEGERACSYLRFDLSAIPRTARILEAELVLSRLFVRGTSGDATVVFRAVTPGQTWDPLELTWNTRPAVAPGPLFRLHLPAPVPGYAGHDGLFPQPNLRSLVRSVSLYRKAGAKGVFMETDAPGLTSGLHCEADLTYWVLMQALWDPSRSADDLIRDFCTHYYGPAGTFIERSVLLLEEAYAQDPHRQAFHVGQYALQSFLGHDVVTSAQALFDQAEDACAGDGVLLGRVRRARLSLDLYSLFNLERFQAEHQHLAGPARDFPWARGALEKRYAEARLVSTRERFPDRDLGAEQEDISKVLAAARQAGVWSLWRTRPPAP